MGHNVVGFPLVNYCGWDVNTPIPLQIRNDGVQDIDFFTGFIGGVPNQRMTIRGTVAGVNAGNVGIGMPNPDMPLCVMGGINDVTQDGWRRGIHLFNHAVIAWAQTFGLPGSQAIFMGHPNFGADQSFYCGLAPNTGPLAAVNYVYRIVDNPVLNLTSPTSGDMEFYHSTNVYANVGVGLNTGVTTILTPTNRVEINTTAITGGAAPVVVAPNGNSDFNVANAGGGTGFTGLRFTDLRSNSTAYTINPGLGVLSIDANGDVIYVPGGGAGLADNGTSISTVTAGTVVLGQDINQVGNPGQLISSREIPMNSNNLYFLGQSTTQGINSVGVGFDPNVWGTMPAKLGAYDEAGTGIGVGRTAVLGWNRNIANSASNQQFVGVGGIADGQETITNKIFHYGGLFSAQHAPNNYGVYGKVNTNDVIMLNNYAGRFEVDVNHSNATNLGILATTINGNISTGVGIITYGGITKTTGIDVLVGLAAGGNTGVVVGGNFLTQTLNTTAPGSAGIISVIIQDTNVTNFPSGYFDGGYVLVTNGMFSTSDSVCKRNIHTCNSGLDILNQLNPVTYQYKVAEMKPMINLPTGTHHGLIAQEVEAILPSLVKSFSTAPTYDTTGVLTSNSTTFKSVNYMELIPIVIDAVKEQQTMIQERDSTINSLQQQLNNQQQQIDDLAALITNCCSQGNGSLQTPNNNTNSNDTYNVIHNTEVRLTDTYCVLGENSPNPFKDHTVINYTLSETIQSAQIMFYNTLGQVIKVVELNDRGEGRLNVYGEDLRSGMYTYSLVIDGNVCESKKMIKE